MIVGRRVDLFNLFNLGLNGNTHEMRKHEETSSPAFEQSSVELKEDIQWNYGMPEHVDDIHETWFVCFCLHEDQQQIDDGTQASLFEHASRIFWLTGKRVPFTRLREFLASKQLDS